MAGRVTHSSACQEPQGPYEIKKKKGREVISRSSRPKTIAARTKMRDAIALPQPSPGHRYTPSCDASQRPEPIGCPRQSSSNTTAAQSNPAGTDRRAIIKRGCHQRQSTHDQGSAYIEGPTAYIWTSHNSGGPMRLRRSTCTCPNHFQPDECQEVEPSRSTRGSSE
jgi:hypothetical protein